MLKILFDIASSSCNTLDMEGQAERLALWDTAYNAWSKTLDLQRHCTDIIYEWRTCTVTENKPETRALVPCFFSLLSHI